MHDPAPCSVRHDRGRIRFALDSRVGDRNLFVIRLSKPTTHLGLATIRFLCARGRVEAGRPALWPLQVVAASQPAHSGQTTHTAHGGLRQAASMVAIAWQRRVRIGA